MQICCRPNAQICSPFCFAMFKVRTSSFESQANSILFDSIRFDRRVCTDDEREQLASLPSDVVEVSKFRFGQLGLDWLNRQVKFARIQIHVRRLDYLEARQFNFKFETSLLLLSFILVVVVVLVLLPSRSLSLCSPVVVRLTWPLEPLSPTTRRPHHQTARQPRASLTRIVS